MIKPRKLIVARVVCVMAIVVFGSACNKKQPPTENIFGAGPRIPNDEGIATDVNLDRVVIDGSRNHRVSGELQSFSTYDGSVMPLLHHKGRYVQVGLNKTKEVIWIAGIGLVQAGSPPSVIYNGTVTNTRNHRVYFQDGTVLALSGRVTPPIKGQKVSCIINSVKHQIVEITVQ